MLIPHDPAKYDRVNNVSVKNNNKNKDEGNARRINQDRHKSYNYNDNIADAVTKKAFTHSYIYMSTLAMIKNIQKSHRH